MPYWLNNALMTGAPDDEIVHIASNLLMLMWLQAALKACASVHDVRLAVVMAPSCTGWVHHSCDLHGT